MSRMATNEYMGAKRRLGDTLRALKTRGGTGIRHIGRVYR